MNRRIVPSSLPAGVILFALGLFARADAGIILQTSTYGGNTYHLIANSGSERISWTDAEAYAVTLGGHLATVNDANENAFLLSTFQASAEAARAAAHPTGGLLFMWIGYNDLASEGNFTWIGGGGTGYTNWEVGEPANNLPDEDVVGMLVNGVTFPGPPSVTWTAGRWHDVVSDFRFDDVTYGIVKVNGIVPAPGAVALLGAAGLVGSRRRRN